MDSPLVCVGVRVCMCVSKGQDAKGERGEKSPIILWCAALPNVWRCHPRRWCHRAGARSGRSVGRDARSGRPCEGRLAGRAAGAGALAGWQGRECQGGFGGHAIVTESEQRTPPLSVPALHTHTATLALPHREARRIRCWGRSFWVTASKSESYDNQMQPGAVYIPPVGRPGCGVFGDLDD